MHSSYLRTLLLSLQDDGTYIQDLHTKLVYKRLRDYMYRLLRLRQ